MWTRFGALHISKTAGRAYTDSMVYLITGKKNEGKTTKLKELFITTDKAYGFVAEKTYDSGQVVMYSLVDLRTGNTRPLARLAGLPLPEDWGNDFSHGPFKFSLTAFQWAEELGRSALSADAQAFFIDELGMIELQGRGHAVLIRKILDSSMDVYIGIRDTNIKKAELCFSFGDYTIIPVDGYP